MAPVDGRSEYLSRRHFLSGVAGSAAVAILAACGGTEKATDTPKQTSGAATTVGTPNTVAATNAPTAASTVIPQAASSSPAPATVGGGPIASPTPLKTSGTVTLEVWGGVPPESGPEVLVAAFNKAFPTVKAHYTRYVYDDTGSTKLDTALQGGTIDVYFSYDVPRMSKRIKGNVAEDVTAYVSADSGIKPWMENTPGIFKYENKFYGLPTTREPNFFYINQTAAAAVGAAIPEKWTLDEWRVFIKQVATGSGDKHVYGVIAPADLAREILGQDFWYKAGGNESNFDHPAFRQDAQLRRGVIDDKTAFPWTEILAQNLRTLPYPLVLNGQANSYVSNPSHLRYFKDDQQFPRNFVTTFAPLPAPPNATKFYNAGTRAGETGGINNWIQMYPKTKNKDAAWALMRYWMTDGAQYMLNAGKIPAFPGTDPDVAVNGLLGPNKDKLFDVAAFKRVAFDSTVIYVTDVITDGAAAIQQIVQAQTDRYLIGEISVDQWVTTIKQQADDAIKKAKA